MTSTSPGRESEHRLLQSELAAALADVRTGPDALHRVRFSVGQILLGLGWSPTKSIRAWRRRLWFRRLRQENGTRFAVLAMIKSPGRVLRSARVAVRERGAAYRAAFGVPEWRQFAQMTRLSLLHGLDADAYYLYWLHDRSRRRFASRYVMTHEAAVM